jgi:hypothetical protein
MGKVKGSWRDCGCGFPALINCPRSGVLSAKAAHILTALGDDAFTVTTVAHTPSSTVVTR